uniref:Uncharacterized protein n=1 Tax=Octopus bimaculoides TaxID=37653 RepID=A0A0L8G508_OCTBM
MTSSFHITYWLSLPVSPFPVSTLFIPFLICDFVTMGLRLHYSLNIKKRANIFHSAQQINSLKFILLFTNPFVLS